MEWKLLLRNFTIIGIYNCTLQRLSSFPEIPENVVPFATGNFCRFTREFFIKWKGLKVFKVSFSFGYPGKLFQVEEIRIYGVVGM